MTPIPWTNEKLQELFSPVLQTLKSHYNCLSTHTSETRIKRYLKNQDKSDYIHDSEPTNTLVWR